MAQKPQFYIPKAPELCEVLQLSGDLFTVRPNELVRKAIDELTFGLHYYVLFTLTHSAINKKPIYFSYTNSPKKDKDGQFDGNEKESGKIGMIPIRGVLNEREFKEKVKSYQQITSTKSFRSLLNHVKRLGKYDVRKLEEYYSSKSEKIAIRLSRSASFFYHRNYLAFEGLDKEKSYVEQY